MFPPYINRARALNPHNPANPRPPPLPPRDSISIPAYSDEQIQQLRAGTAAPMPVLQGPVPPGLIPTAPGPAPPPITVLHIGGNQNPNLALVLNKNMVTAMQKRRAECAEQNATLFAAISMILGVLIDTLLYRFSLGIINNAGRLIDSEGRPIPRSPRPERKRRYVEQHKQSKKTSSLRYRKGKGGMATSFTDRLRDSGHLGFSVSKNWRDFQQIDRFRERINHKDEIDRNYTYMYEREKALFYRDPNNEGKPFYPRFLPIVGGKAKNIDDWRITTGPNGQLVQPQIVMPSLPQNNNANPSTSTAMDTNDDATEIDGDADDIGMANFDDDDEPVDLPPLPPRPGVYEFVPMTFRPPKYVPPPPWKSIPGIPLDISSLLGGKSETEIRKGKFKAIQPDVEDLTGWEAAFRQSQVWYNPKSILNIEQGLVPPYEHRQHASRDPPPSPPGCGNPVPVPSSSAARNQAPSAPSAPLKSREPEPSTPIASGSGSQQPVRRAPLQPVSQTQLPATQPTSSAAPLYKPASLLSRLSPSDVRQEESFGDENVGPSAHSTYVETPIPLNLAEATVTAFADANPTQFQQPPTPAATATYVAPVSAFNVFAHNAYSNVQEPQIPVALSAFPPSSQDTQSTSINIDNIMGWTGSQPPAAAPTSWASLAAQVSTTCWWGTQAFQQPADSPSISVQDEAMDTSPSYYGSFADTAMNVDVLDVQMGSPPPAFDQPAYSSNIPNEVPYVSSLVLT
ncbi:hypothetical protein M413DRAFT_262612 [Hebeloma cylindrosporum]|uniref:Uncharacterized protein n=1 Tax=Hebeloma cylindrosporum TaxID=76867 RepID=A0A0C3CDC5_HEBCY|nr:hypothetical protein M413DRAFT_262612 [Hebeloma cylindrosporum h7]